MNVSKHTINDRLCKIDCKIRREYNDVYTLFIGRVAGSITFNIKYIPMIIYFIMCPEETKRLVHRNWFTVRGDLSDGVERHFIIKLPDLETNYIPNINHRTCNKIMLELVLILTDIYNSGNVRDNNLCCILDAIKRKKGMGCNIKTKEDLINMGRNMTTNYISSTF